MLAQISNIEVSDDHKIKFYFDDGFTKTVDFKPFIGEDFLTKPLGDVEYFKKVKLYDRGRGIYWENGYDFCPDYLRTLEPAK